MWKVGLSRGSRHRFQWQITGPQWQIAESEWHITGPKLPPLPVANYGSTVANYGSTVANYGVTVANYRARAGRLLCIGSEQPQWQIMESQWQITGLEQAASFVFRNKKAPAGMLLLRNASY